jgi:hypothetical protein
MIAGTAVSAARRFRFARVLLVAGLIACGANREDDPSDPSRGSSDGGADAAAPAGSEGRQDWFVEQAAASGLDFVHFNGSSGRFYFPEMLPGGVALFDYDGDGDLDVYCVQGRVLGDSKSDPSVSLAPPPAAVPLRGRLFRNDLISGADGMRTLRFTDVTDASRINALGFGMGVAAADVDNDGCVDLYLTNFGPNQLLRNNCDGTFTDVSETSGTDDEGWSVSASFLDYDRDGLLDLYVGNYVHYALDSDRRCTGLTGRQDYCPPSVYRAQADRLYRNNGNGKFADVTSKALLGGPFGPALGVATADFNGDGWIDIYVANDGTENLLWINQRDGTFRNEGLLSGAALSGDGKPEGSMGVDAGDFDNDGDEDLFMTHLPAEGNNLYVNDGSGLFEDMSASSGLGPSSLGYTGFGTAWFDFDNDGWLDLMAANGAIEARKERSGEPFPYDERNLLFRNLRNGRFEDVTRQAGATFELSRVSRGAAFGDIDNDGDVDILMGQINGAVRLLVNTLGGRRHWIGLRLVGVEAPRDMLGATVEIVRRSGPALWRRVRSDASYASANDPRVLVGLGESTETPTVRVRWPDGRTGEWRDLAIDRWTTLKEGRSR